MKNWHFRRFQFLNYSEIEEPYFILKLKRYELLSLNYVWINEALLWLSSSIALIVANNNLVLIVGQPNYFPLTVFKALQGSNHAFFDPVIKNCVISGGWKVHHVKQHNFMPKKTGNLWHHHIILIQSMQKLNVNGR